MAALRAEQIYPSIDLNCDDKVLGVELNFMFYSVGQYYNEKTGNPAPTDEQVTEIANRAMSMIDANHDQSISRAEFVEYARNSA